jgi:hypothetical protein
VAIITLPKVQKVSATLICARRKALKTAIFKPPEAVEAAEVGPRNQISLARLSGKGFSIDAAEFVDYFVVRTCHDNSP